MTSFRFDDIISGLPRFHVGRAGLDPALPRFQIGRAALDPTLPRFQVGRAGLVPTLDPFSRRSYARDPSHVGQMRLSDWSIQKILRSDWLGRTATPVTTNLARYTRNFEIKFRKMSVSICSPSGNFRNFWSNRKRPETQLYSKH